MEPEEGEAGDLPDPRFIKQEVTYQLVPFFENQGFEGCRSIKQEPLDDIEDISLEHVVKEELAASEEYLMIDKCDIPNEREDLREENSEEHEAEVSMKLNMQEKRIISKRNIMKDHEKKLAFSSGKIFTTSNNIQKSNNVDLNTLSADIHSVEEQLLENDFCHDGIKKDNDKNEVSLGNPQKRKTSARNKSQNDKHIVLNIEENIQSKPYECHICGKGFSFSSNRSRHMAIHLKKRHTCDICRKSFARLDNLKEHMSLHVVEGEKCFTSTSNVNKPSTNLFNPHVKALEKSSVPVNLQKNKFVSKRKKPQPPKSSMATLCIKVPKLNTIRRTFPCHVCGETFSWEYLLKRHKQRHVKKLNVKNDAVQAATRSAYSCNVCNKNYSSKTHLIRHQLTNIHKYHLKLMQHKAKDKDKKKYYCDTCNKTFAFLHGLARHKYTIIHIANEKEKLKEMSERNRNKYSCNRCGKEFASDELLEKHKLRHLNAFDLKGKKINGNRYPCSTCGKSFVWPSELRKHLHCDSHTFLTLNMKKDVQNENIKTDYPCSCGKTFHRAYHLRKHQYRTGHISYVFKYPCKLCGMAFSRSSDLSRHKIMAGHSSVLENDENTKLKEKAKASYSCNRCDRTFPWAYQLNNHKVCHMTKKYPCNVCGKYFAAEYLLKKHKVVHLKRLNNLKHARVQLGTENVYACNSCGKKFSQLSCLRKHKPMCRRLPKIFSLGKKELNDNAKNIYSGDDKIHPLPNGLFATEKLSTAAAEEKVNINLDYACSTCKKTFLRPSDLSRHKIMAGHTDQADKWENKEPHINNQSKYACDTCGKVLPRLSGLKKHIALTGHISQTSNTKKEYVKLQNSHDIDTNFVSPSSRNQEKFIVADITKAVNVEKEKANNTKMYYPCNDCDKMFYRRSDMSRHTGSTGHSVQTLGFVVQVPNTNTKLQYSCGTCSKTFPRQNILCRHVAVTGHAYRSEKGNLNENNKHHYHNDTFTRTIPSSGDLNIQLSGKPNSEEMHSCSTCGKTFPWQYHLKNHRCSHAVKKYSCKICSRHFSQEYLLKRHKLLHAAPKVSHNSYSCSTCGRTFSRLSDLSKHANTYGHTFNVISERKLTNSNAKFVCKACNKQFARSNDLKRHLLTRTHISRSQNMEEVKSPKDNASEYPYDISKKKFFQSNDMLRQKIMSVNVKKQTKNNKGVYECAVCKKKYSWLSSLCKHRALAGHISKTS